MYIIAVIIEKTNGIKKLFQFGQCPNLKIKMSMRKP